MPSAADYQRTLEIDTRNALEGELDRVVAEAVEHALANPGYGILVTRCGPGSFTVRLSDDVPQGTIAELDLSTR